MINSTRKFSILLAALISTASIAETHFDIRDLSYVGAMRFKNGTFGESRLGFANGAIAVSNERNSVFIVGHAQHQAIAEFDLAGFSNSEDILDLPMANPRQDFVSVIDKASTGNPEGLTRITGMSLINQRLIVNAAKFYDATASNTDTTLRIENVSNLTHSEISGFLKVQGSVKAAGWITPIPRQLRDTLGGDYISGYASNLPINVRNSMGPSAYSLESNDLLSAVNGAEIKTNELLSYSTANQLHPDHYNNNLTNDIWTEVSNAYTGFIVPGTNTYAVFGNSGGHYSGIGYKITQDDGHNCGGACPYKVSDQYNYYWLYDLNDFIKVKNGSLNPYEVRPFSYGRLTLPFESLRDANKPSLISGAYYDFENQFIYFLLARADALQNQFESLPLLLKYEINVGQRPLAPLNATAIEN
ncbi:MAG: hypothetical protein ACX931_15660 [Saccharospirillum sp.]